MGMSTHITALRDNGGEFKKMMEALEFCRERSLSYPREVTEYFSSNVNESIEYIENSMLKVDISSIIRNYKREMIDGLEIDVKDIPKEVKTIRFFNSY